jgi:hypothetical protein
MNIVEPTDEQVLIPVRMLKESQGFRAELHGLEQGYGYYVKCDPNPGFLRVAYKGVMFTSSEAMGNTLVFNVRENRLGVIKSDTMVEPINFTVTSERTE